MSYDAISWGNAVFPLLVLLAVAITLPRVVVSRTWTQGRVAMAVGVTGLVLWVIGAVIFMAQYQILGTDVMHDVATRPLRTAGIYLQRSLWFALFWGPVVAFVWLVLAQGVERRRGLAMRDGAEKN